MIKEFGVLYQGGVVEGDDIGFGGTAVHDRRYGNERVLSAVDQSLALARAAESAGLSTLWLAEHHFQHEGFECIPNIPLVGLWIAQQTHAIKIGCGFNVLPTWNPIRLAEDFSVVDHVTGGRLIFGVGRGYHEREIVALNDHVVKLDEDGRRDLFEEQVELLFKVMTQESWSHQGRYYQVPPTGSTHTGLPLEELTLVPRPSTPPIVWQPTTSGNPRGLDFMARHGIHGMVAGMPESVVDTIVKGFLTANSRAGRDLVPGERMAVGFRAYLADTEEQARAELRPLYDEYSKFGAPLGVNPFSEELVALHHRRGLPVPENPRMSSFDEALSSGAWFAGTASQFVDKLHGLQDRLPGLEHVLLNLHIPATAAQNLEQIERIGRDVIPHLAGIPTRALA